MRNRIGNAGLTAAISMALLAAFPVIAWAAPVLPAGITAGSQSLAGMTAEEAKAAVQEYVDGLAAQSVTLSVDGQDVATTAGELGFHWINTDVIEPFHSALWALFSSRYCITSGAKISLYFSRNSSKSSVFT